MRLLHLPTSAVAVSEYGNPEGEPLLYFHGWPGSGRQAALVDRAAKKYGFHVFAPDRPGLGRSERIAGRSIAAWPTLVAEMAGALHLESFAVLGISGGGPYALACAAAMPGRIRATSIVCGAPPIAELPHHGRLSPVYRWLLWLFHRWPAIVRRLFGVSRRLLFWQDARAFWRPLRALLPGPDGEALEDREAFDTVFDSNRDAFQDVDGLFADAALYAAPWGIPLEKIEVPVQLWHGVEDTNFHWSLAHELAGRLPHATFHLVEGEAHFSLPIRRADTILSALRAACGRTETCPARASV